MINARAKMAASALLLLAVSLTGTANAAVISTVPRTTTWVADGTTEYEISVYVDNTGLGGQHTDGIQWRFLNTPGLTFIEAVVPTQDDFFAGIPMWDNEVLPPGGLSWRQTEERSAGPIDHQGNVGTYKFTVSRDITPGQYSFNLTDILMLDDGFPVGLPQPHTIQNIPFNVIPSILGDVNCDGSVNFQDINPFVLLLTNQGQWQASYPGCPVSHGDINQDGSVDFKDINPFVACLTNPSGCN